MIYYDLLQENNFVFDESFAGVGYIMKDGLFLSLKANKDKFEKFGDLFNSFNRYLLTLSNPGAIYPRLLKSTEDNAIVVDGYNIDLPKESLTEEQYNALTSLFNKRVIEFNRPVNILNSYKVPHSKSFDLKNNSVEYIISFIKGLYN